MSPITISEQHRIHVSYDGDEAHMPAAFRWLVRNVRDIYGLYDESTLALFEDVDLQLSDIPEDKLESAFGNIFISPSVVEKLWLFNYLNHALEARISWDALLEQPAKMEYTEEMKACIDRLLSVDTQSQEWPSALPAMDSGSVTKNPADFAAASSLTLAGLAAAMLHELKHLQIRKNGHEELEKITDDYERRMREETLADEFCVTQFFQFSGKNTLSRPERNTACTQRMKALLGMGALFSYEELVRKTESDSHPNGVLRMNRFITQKSRILSLPTDWVNELTDEDFDIRPSIGYAAIVLSVYFQLVTCNPRQSENLNDKYKNRLLFMMGGQVFDTLTHVYLELYQHAMQYCREKYGS